MELTALQIAFLGSLAILFTWGLKLLALYNGFQPPRWVTSLVLFVTSLVMAVVWSPIAWPPLPDLTDVSSYFAFLASLFTIAGPVLAFAFLIYNFLYEKVFNPAANRIREARAAMFKKKPVYTTKK